MSKHRIEIVIDLNDDEHESLDVEENRFAAHPSDWDFDDIVQADAAGILNEVEVVDYTDLGEG